jgi:hypothetical protein
VFAQRAIPLLRSLCGGAKQFRDFGPRHSTRASRFNRFGEMTFTASAFYNGALQLIFGDWAFVACIRFVVLESSSEFIGMVKHVLD